MHLEEMLIWFNIQGMRNLQLGSLLCRKRTQTLSPNMLTSTRPSGTTAQILQGKLL